MASPTVRSAPRARPSGRITQSVAVREHNLSMALSVIAHSPDPISRAEVAQVMGVTRATATALVDTLVDARLVEELAPVYSGRAGRPAVPVRLARRTVAGLGLEVDVEFLGVRALDLAGDTLFESVREQDFRGSDPRAVLGEAARRADAIAAQLAGDGVRLAGAVLALPGIADAPLGPLRLAPNLRWADVDIPGLTIMRETRLLGVDNEAKLAARAELATIGPGESRSFLYLSGGFGIGGTVVLDGHTFGGAHGWAGEVGHVTVDPAGPECTCGSRGCLETFAGRRALMRSAGLDPQAPASALVTALNEGTEAADEAVGAAGHALGIALGSALNILDIDEVVLGGFLAPLLPYLAEAMVAELSTRAMSTRLTGGEPVVRSSKAGPLPALTGAALTALDSVFSSPEALP